MFSKYNSDANASVQIWPCCGNGKMISPAATVATMTITAGTTILRNNRPKYLARLIRPAFSVTSRNSIAVKRKPEIVRKRSEERRVGKERKTTSEEAPERKE